MDWHWICALAGACHELPNRESVSLDLSVSTVSLLPCSIALRAHPDVSGNGTTTPKLEKLGGEGLAEAP